MKKAYLYHQLDQKKVKCDLCRQGCIISPGQKGLCGVRKNIDGELYSLNYAQAMAANIDPVEKKPLYHFLPGSRAFSIGAAGCNFSCKFCQNWQSSQITKGKSGKVIGEFFPSEEVVQAALQYNCPSIAYTYTEPTVFFEYALDTAKLAKKKGLKNIFVSNGYETKQAINELVKVIDAINFDLKAFTNNFYQEICGAKLEPVLDAIRYTYEQGIWIELTTMIIPGKNDDEAELKKLTEFIAKLDPTIPWHVTRFIPQYKMLDVKTTPLETMKKAAKIGRDAGLNYIYLGNVNDDEYLHTICPQCQQKVIDRTNYRGESNLDENVCPYCGYEIEGVFA
ncbi:MAG: AmmeMemoRadiSam system radical SAM enzyme [Patescibacteria group bacterium]|nr:AmmeMemoRadiSam system radical SAM enzyme [Patescibacteria group bacterium]